MGQIADALRAKLRTIARSDARGLRDLDRELTLARDAVAAPSLATSAPVTALLGKGSFMDQTLATLRGLCKRHGIRGYSKLTKARLAELLEAHGVEAPPRPLERLTKRELIALVRVLMNVEA